MDATHGSLVNLNALGIIISRMRVDVVSLKVIAINKASLSRMDVAVSVSVKSWLSKIGGKSRISHQSTSLFQLLDFSSNTVALSLSEYDFFLGLSGWRLSGLLSRLSFTRLFG